MPRLTIAGASEAAQMHALAAARRAIRAGDIDLAERWMRLAERHYKCVEHVHRNASRWGQFRKRMADEDKAREAAAAVYRARVKARGDT